MNAKRGEKLLKENGLLRLRAESAERERDELIKSIIEVLKIGNLNNGAKIELSDTIKRIKGEEK